MADLEEASQEFTKIDNSLGHTRPELKIPESAKNSHQAIEDLANTQIHESVIDFENFPFERKIFPEGMVDVRVIKPSSENSNTDVPMVMLCGMAMNSKIIENNIGRLAQNGKNVITVDFIGEGPGVPGEEGSSGEINRQAELLAQTLGQIEGKVDLSAISFSSLTLLALQKNHPDIVREKIRNAVLIFPTITGKEGVGYLGKKFAKEWLRGKKRETKQNLPQKNDLEQKGINKQVIPMTVKYYASNPVRTIKEIWAVAHEKGYEDLPALYENLGGRVGIIQGQADRLVSNVDLWKKIGEDSRPPFRKLTQEMFDADPRYKEHNIKVGDDIWDPEVKNEAPPFSVIHMREGGHERSGHSSMADDILQTVDYLNSTKLEK